MFIRPEYFIRMTTELGDFENGFKFKGIEQIALSSSAVSCFIEIKIKNIRETLYFRIIFFDIKIK